MTSVGFLSKKASVDWQRKADGKTVFRPGERALMKITRGMLDDLPQHNAKDLIEHRIDSVEFVEATVAHLEAYRKPLEAALFVIMREASKEAEKRIRRAVNHDLTRLGSPVRLIDPRDVTKATRFAKEKPVNIEWWGVVDPDTPLRNLDAFNMVDPRAELAVISRTSAGGILSRVAATEEATIMRQIHLGFTGEQTFSTGRTVIGRTTAQTARSIIPILESTTAAAMTLTPGELALYRSSHTNGLFPRWAQAVNNYSDNIAGQLARQGVTGAKALDALNTKTKRYSNRLRRSRAKMIARTETSIAQNAARQASFTEARRSGVVGDKAKKRWVTSRTDVCPICAPMGGRTTKISDAFSWQGGFGNPPAHPNCQCSIRMVTNVNKPPELIGSGSIGDPYRYQFADGWSPSVAAHRGGLPSIPRLPKPKPPTPKPQPPTPQAPTPAPTPQPGSALTSNEALVWDDAGRVWADLTDVEKRYLIDHQLDTGIREAMRQNALPNRAGVNMKPLSDDAVAEIKAIRAQQELVDDLVRAREELHALSTSIDNYTEVSIHLRGRGARFNFDELTQRWVGQSLDPNIPFDPAEVMKRLNELKKEMLDALTQGLAQLETEVTNLGRMIFNEAQARVTTPVLENVGQVRENIRGILHELRGFGDETFSTGPVNVAGRKSLARASTIEDSVETLNRVAADWIPDDWVTSANSRGDLGFYRRSDRAHYFDEAMRTPGPTGDGLINIGPVDAGGLSDSTMLHEVSHRTQLNTTTHGDLELQFWTRRTTAPPGLEGDPRYAMQNYYGSSRERGIPDDFVEKYTGKVYSGKPLETSTMLTEQLAGLGDWGTHSYGGNWWQDTDSIHWMTGMLAGV